MGQYNPPEAIKTEIVATMPEKFAKSGSQPGTVSIRDAWPRTAVDFYLEDPSLDRDGILYFTDVPHSNGNIFIVRMPIAGLKMYAHL